MVRALGYAATTAAGLYAIMGFDSWSSSPVVLIVSGAAGYVGWATKYHPSREKQRPLR